MLDEAIQLLHVARKNLRGQPYRLLPPFRAVVLRVTAPSPKSIAVTIGYFSFDNKFCPRHTSLSSQSCW